jgi:hypothetical protein
MATFMKQAILLGLVVAQPLCGQAQDHDFPILNSVGRYLGVGYTRGGYHAAYDGRPNVVTDRHPAADYRPGGFQNFQQPAYYANSMPYGAAITPTSPAPMTLNPVGTQPKPTGQSAIGSAPGAEPEVLPPPPTQAPTKPTGPPPTWLKDYLQDEQAKQPPTATSSPAKNIVPQQPSLDKLPAPEGSPSDLLLNDTSDDLLPALGVTYSIIEQGAWRTSPAGNAGPTASGSNRYHSYQVRQ